MLFNSLSFLIFFPVVTILYFVLPHRFRWLLLLLASCIFYMAFIPAYILILFVTIIVDYCAGIWIEKTSGQKRKIFLVASIITNVGFLAVFKYWGFATENLNALADFLHWNYTIPTLKILLPVGLSFHTFQAMSYTIEVYRGRQAAERHFGIYALYVMFYPQLVAGPIERPQNLIHQFYEQHYFEYKRVTDGLKLMLWGLFKKVVIADRVAIMVDAVYDDPTGYHGVALIIATVFFAFQIFCDFSGYSDIAIGSAQVMGFKLMTNFNRPYFSKSISEFWKRWHISLSTWFRDYLYIPLGGNRVSKLRCYFNLFFVFLVSGFWHGANWTFVIWGALHGFYLLFASWTKNVREKFAVLSGLTRWPILRKFFRAGVTFALVCLGWIFFRARNVGEAFYIIKHLADGAGNFFTDIFRWDFVQHDIFLGQTPGRIFVAISAIIFMETIHLMQRRGSLREALAKKPIYIRWGVYLALLWAIIFFGKFGERQFIYFVF